METDDSSDENLFIPNIEDKNIDYLTNQYVDNLRKLNAIDLLNEIFRIMNGKENFIKFMKNEKRKEIARIN